jgi:hypothetical protein
MASWGLVGRGEDLERLGDGTAGRELAVGEEIARPALRW